MKYTFGQSRNLVYKRAEMVFKLAQRISKPAGSVPLTSSFPGPVDKWVVVLIWVKAAQLVCGFPQICPVLQMYSQFEMLWLDLMNWAGPSIAASPVLSAINSPAYTFGTSPSGTSTVSPSHRALSASVAAALQAEVASSSSASGVLASPPTSQPSSQPQSQAPLQTPFQPSCLQPSTARIGALNRAARTRLVELLQQPRRWIQQHVSECASALGVWRERERLAGDIASASGGAEAAHVSTAQVLFEQALGVAEQAAVSELKRQGDGPDDAVVQLYRMAYYVLDQAWGGVLVASLMNHERLRVLLTGRHRFAYSAQ